MHHLELSMSSVQHVWHLGTAKKPGEVFKDTLLSAFATFSVSRGADLSFLPVKESRMFLAPRNIPLAQLNRGSQSFIYRFQLCLEVCVCSFHWCDGRSINQTSFPSISQPASHLHKCGAVCCTCLDTCSQAGRWDHWLWTKHGHEWTGCWLFFPPEHSVAPGSSSDGADGLAFRVHTVHGHGRLQMVAVMQRGVMQAVVVELVTQQRGGLGWRVQLQILIVVPHVHPGRQGVTGARRVFAVFLWAHGAVA